MSRARPRSLSFNRISMIIASHFVIFTGVHFIYNKWIHIYMHRLRIIINKPWMMHASFFHCFAAVFSYHFGFCVDMWWLFVCVCVWYARIFIVMVRNWISELFAYISFLFNLQSPFQLNTISTAMANVRLWPFFISHPPLL